MEPEFVVDELEIEWQNELNLAENMRAIINEFKTSRKLSAVNVILHGPPTAGKTTLARYIAERYGNHYISVKSMIDDTIANLVYCRSLINQREHFVFVSFQKETIDNEKNKLKIKEEKENVKQDAAGEEGEEEEDEDEEVDIEELEQQLHDIENVIVYTENGRLPDEDVTRLMKAYISKNFCQNQGYVLDGYPKTLKQVSA